MPNIANIVVKKADGTTDATYTAVQPAAGENPAVYRNTAVGTTRAEQPELRISGKARPVKGVQFRDINSTFKWPKSVTSPSGDKTVSDGVFVAIQVHVNQTMSASDAKEAVYQALNIAATAAMKEMAETGYAAS